MGQYEGEGKTNVAEGKHSVGGWGLGFLARIIWPKPAIVLSCGVALASMICGTLIGAWAVSRYNDNQAKRGALTRVYANGWSKEGVETVTYDRAADERGINKVILIQYLSGLSRSVRDDVKLVTHFPPDREKSGLYVNDMKLELVPGPAVYFVSDVVGLRRVNMNNDEVDDLQAAAEGPQLGPFLKIVRSVRERAEGGSDQAQHIHRGAGAEPER